MENRPVRLSKPVYELLPYLYIALGLLAFLAAYLWSGRIWADVALGLGLLSTLGGAVLLLRRKDYRDNRARYKGGALQDPDDFKKP